MCSKYNVSHSVDIDQYPCQLQWFHYTHELQTVTERLMANNALYKHCIRLCFLYQFFENVGKLKLLFTAKIFFSCKWYPLTCADRVLAFIQSPFTDGFSIAIEMRWEYCFTLTSILIQWCYKILHKVRQLCCRVMRQNMLRSEGMQGNYSESKLPSNLNCGP